MKKAAWWFLGIYIVYMIIVSVYFFAIVNPGVPAAVKGTAADPTVFMTHHQQVLSEQYTNTEDAIYFLTLPFEWGLYFFILVFGFSAWLKKSVQMSFRNRIVQGVFYFFCLSVVAWIITLPIDYASHAVSLHYGVSVQTFQSWMKDQLTNFWVNSLISGIVLAAVYFFMKRYPRRWWLPVWVLSIPFLALLMYIQPVWIDPLYNSFHPLAKGPLKTDILQLAHKANIPAHNVYEVTMSDKTNALNAYVNGIGSHLRIVLWDTTVQRMKPNQVLFVMAHEMGHYVMHHLFLSMIGTVIFAFIGLYITSRIHRWAVRRYGTRMGFSVQHDLASIPLILLIFSLLNFTATPIENAVSRHYEHQADAYGMQLTQNKKAAIGAFQQLTISGLSEVNPPWIVKFFQYGHPTMLERIQYVENYKP